MTLKDEDENVVLELFENVSKTCSSNDPQEFRSLLIEQQQKILQCADKRGRRWHPLIIR